jgi:hypothetical protein
MHSIVLTLLESLPSPRHVQESELLLSSSAGKPRSCRRAASADNGMDCASSKRRTRRLVVLRLRFAHRSANLIAVSRSCSHFISENICSTMGEQDQYFSTTASKLVLAQYWRREMSPVRQEFNFYS